KDPELNALIHAQTEKDFVPEQMEFLKDLEHYNTLVEKAEKYRRENGLADHNNINANDNDSNNDQDEYKILLQDVRNKASAIYDTYIVDGSPNELNLPGGTKSRLLNFKDQIENADLGQLKGLFGNTDRGAHREVLSVLKLKYEALQRRLQATTLPVGFQSKQGVRYGLSIEDLKAMKNEMKPDDNLRMSKKTVYIKPKDSLKKKQWISRSHTKSRWYHTIGALFSFNTRRAKFINAKRAVRDAMFTHLNDKLLENGDDKLAANKGDKRLANKIMRRVARSSDGFSKAELSAIAEFAKAKTDIDDQLRKLKQENRLTEINSMTGQDVLDAWKNDSDNKTAGMVSNYAKIYQPCAQQSAIEFIKLKNEVNELGGQNDSVSRCGGQDTLNKEDLKLAQSHAKQILRNSVGLSSRARASLKRFINLSGERYGDWETKVLDALTTALDDCAEKLANKALWSFRNDPKFARFIGMHGLNSTQNNMTKQDLNGLTAKNLVANPDDVRMAFRMHCQLTGRNEAHLVQLAKFSRSLTALVENWSGKMDKDIKAEMQTKAKDLLYQTEGWNDDNRKSDHNRSPKGVLKCLAKGKDVTKDDVLFLANSINNSVQRCIDEFRDYMEKLEDQGKWNVGNGINLVDNNDVR
ncbi:MAG: hypothetical protein MI861_23745, partial [Pirellulales bacterium]|nr:hypothetical protein [Pirellulales bacterium]